MKGKVSLLVPLAIGIMILFAIGCGDDEKVTNGDTQNVLSDRDAVEYVVSSLDDDATGFDGLSLVQGAVSSAVSDFKDYEVPDIDGTTGGFGKIAVPQTDTFYYENGWHIFFADETVTTEDDSTTMVWDFEIADSTRLEKDGVPGFLLPDPDFVDMRTHIDLEFDQQSQDSDIDLDISLYRHGVLSLDTDMKLWVDLDEIFDVKVVFTGQGDLQPVNLRYEYDIAVNDLVLIEADDYDCPTSGTIDMTVSVYVTDGTNTLTGSAEVHLVVTGPGVVTGTVTSGDYVVTFTDDDFCADASSLPDNPWVRFLSM